MASISMVVITGAPGVGKSAVGAELAPLLDTGVVLDMDLTGRPEYASDMELLDEWLRDWLRIAVAVARGGRFLVLAGFVRPRDLERLPEWRDLESVSFIALTCDGQELGRRLRARKESLGIGEEEVESLIRLNDEVKRIAAGDERVVELDVSSASVREAARATRDIICERVSARGVV